MCVSSKCTNLFSAIGFLQTSNVGTDVDAGGFVDFALFGSPGPALILPFLGLGEFLPGHVRVLHSLPDLARAVEPNALRQEDAQFDGRTGA